MTAIDTKRLNEMIAGMKLYADMPYGVKINEFSAKDLYSAMVELREMRTSRQWVPVSERLPEQDGPYLILGNQFCSVSIRSFKNGKFDSLCPVTHWMPLPPPLSEATNA